MKMSENPLQSLFQNVEKLSKCLQHQLSNFIGPTDSPLPINKKPLFSVSSSSRGELPRSEADSAHTMEILKKKGPAAAPVTKEDLGRATWTFLHTLAAQYPDNPTRQQKKDVKDLMAILSRMYPCQECADHFKEVLRLDLMPSFPSGYVIYIMLLTEVWESWCFLASELMQDGESLNVSSGLVMFKELPPYLTNEINTLCSSYTHKSYSP